jgi:hypothetical protein
MSAQVPAVARTPGLTAAVAQFFKLSLADAQELDDERFARLVRLLRQRTGADR